MYNYVLHLDIEHWTCGILLIFFVVNNGAIACHSFSKISYWPKVRINVPKVLAV